MSVFRNLLAYKIQSQDVLNHTPLTFTANQANSTVKLSQVGSPNSISMSYSTDGQTWNNYTINQEITLTNVSDYVKFKCTTNTFSSSSENYYKFVMTGMISASGQIDSLINYGNISDYCYSHLFDHCVSLTSSPVLSSTTTSDYCYMAMFLGCVNLTNAPQLYADTLAIGCYQYMFYGCISLTSSPVLSATTLSDYCYVYMFYGCNNLNNVTANFGEWLSDATNNWLYGVSSSGTFHKSPSLTTLTIGDSNIPSNWNIQNIN